jgi:hypothetical protein
MPASGQSDDLRGCISLAQPDTTREARILRYGWVKRVAAGNTGDRHVAIVKRDTTRIPNVEWCEFEEQPGAGPAMNSGNDFIVFRTRIGGCRYPRERCQ